MATTLTGNPSNVTTPLGATIHAAVSGGGVITCTTSSAHLFGNGDDVVIQGGTGLTALNGTWTITVTGSTTFTIPTTGGGSYTADSATASDISLTPQVSVTSDGDALAMQANLLSSLQALLDRTQGINKRLDLPGTRRLVGVITNTGGALSTAWASNTAYVAANAVQMGSTTFTATPRSGGTYIFETFFSGTLVLTLLQAAGSAGVSDVHFQLWSKHAASTAAAQVVSADIESAVYNPAISNTIKMPIASVSLDTMTTYGVWAPYANGFQATGGLYSAMDISAWTLLTRVYEAT